LISSFLDTPLPGDGVVFGEIALSGDVRPVGRTEARLKEAAKLGFNRALAPNGADGAGLRIDSVDTVQALVRRLGQDPA